ncbi:MAG: peptidoglycan DD-metalloendopeptidase family protein [Deltaproteobacteria bacterium]|nr:peptidoglycan DD-metalloendopeptidase family protein [Deltaproteobacteria bacterium]
MSPVQICSKDPSPLLLRGTVVIQLVVVLAAVMIKFSLPAHRVDLPRVSEAAPVDDMLVPTQAVEHLAMEDIVEEDPVSAPGQIGPRIMVYRVQSGDTLSRIWANVGAPTSGPVLAAKAFKAAGVSLSALRSGEDIELQISPVGDITALRKKLPEGRELLLDGDSNLGYTATVANPKIVKKERVASGTITLSFAKAAERVSVPANIVDELVDLFSSRVEFRKDLQRGDIFSVVYDEHVTKDGEFIKAGPIKAASLEKGGRTLYAIRYVGKDGKPHFYDQNGQPLGNSFLRYPLKFTRISSAFSYARFHPVLKKTRPHNGIDYAAPLGTPVRTVADGVVTHAGYSLSAGNWIKISHGDRYATDYLHLHRISSGIRKGVRVSRGQVIGTVGSTGLSTGPHLHFSFYDRGKYVNPLRNDLPTNSFAVEKISPAVLQASLDKLKQSQQIVRLASLLVGVRGS